MDETSLWDGGRFPTTVLIVSRSYLDRFPGTIAELLTAHLAQLDAIAADPDSAKSAANEALAQVAGKPLKPEVLDRAFDRLEPTADPLAADLAQLAVDGVEAGLLDAAPDLSHIFDLRILNRLLLAHGQEPVSAAGFGQE